MKVHESTSWCLLRIEGGTSMVKSLYTLVKSMERGLYWISGSAELTDLVLDVISVLEHKSSNTISGMNELLLLLFFSLLVSQKVL